MAAKKREELLNLIPAYALDALDENERAELETWLQDDPEAQGLLDDYRAITNHLVALAPFHHAPAHLQVDLRRRLAASRSDALGESGTLPPEVNRRFGGRRGAWILAAAALVLVVLVGVILIQINSTDSHNPIPDLAELYAQLITQPGSSQYTIVPGEVDEAVSGSLIVSPDGQQAVMRVAYLPPITRDQAFQMWLIDDNGTRTSGGLIQADNSQEIVYVQVPFDRPVTAYQGVGISLEPAGGSPYADQPTGPRVLSIPLG